jgi:hypothetical protein
MMPIHELLSRIRWDAEFAHGEFELGYFDRLEKRVILVPFRKISFPEKDPGRFQLIDAAGQLHRVPFPSCARVYKDGQRIWHRPDSA